MNLNRLLIFALTAYAAVSCGTTETKPAIPRDNEIEAKVERVLKGMTLE